MPSDELQQVLNDTLLNDDPQLDWTLRHGRSLRGAQAGRSANLLCRLQLQDPRHPALVPGLGQNRHRLERHPQHLLLPDAPSPAGGAETPEAVLIPTSLILPFAKTLNHASNEVKQLLAQASLQLFRTVPQMLPLELLRCLVPQLVNGTKEKNSAVRAGCEAALVSVL